MINFYHGDDPKGVHVWHWVYAHGDAEDLNQQIQNENDWQSAADLLSSDTPLPTIPGEYQGMLYGKPIIAVLAKRHNFLGGRAALADDKDALDHCRRPEDWR